MGGKIRKDTSRIMAESGIQAKEKEQEDAVRGKLEQLAEEELGETEEVESHKKQSLCFFKASSKGSRLHT